MKKLAGWLLLLVCFSAALFGGCGAAAPAEESWSIYLYLCGTDLETDSGSATQNLTELLKAPIPENCNVIIQTGGTAQWHTAGISPEALQRFRITNHRLELLEELPLDSMGKGETLRDFLSFGMTNYPAENTALVLWNHGGGSIGGAVYDQLFDDDSLMLDELSFALSGALSGGKEKLQLIGFDACLMATVETAQAVAPYAEYMVASEETEPSSGWNYYNLMRYLADHSADGAQGVGREICDSYYNKCRMVEMQTIATISLTDLSKVEQLTQAFDSAAAELLNCLGDRERFSILSKSALKAENYGGNSAEEGYTNMVDLYDLMEQWSPVLGDRADAVCSAVEDAVVYYKTGDERAEGRGLAVYYPLSQMPGELNAYEGISVSSRYLEFLYNMSYGHADGQSDVRFAQDAFINDENYLELHIDPDTLDNVSTIHNVMHRRDGENRLLALGFDTDVTVDWDSGTVTDHFSGYWPALNGHHLSMSVIEEGEDYNLYSALVLKNGERTNLRFRYVWDADGEGGHYEVIGYWDGISGSGMSARPSGQPQQGDVITPLFEICAEDGAGTGEYAEGESFTIEGAAVIDDAPLPEGEYLYRFDVIDLFGNSRLSESALLTCEDDEWYIS